MKSVHYLLVNSRTAYELINLPEVTKLAFSSLSSAGVRGSGYKCPAPVYGLGQFSQHRDQTQSLSHPVVPEPPSHRHLLYAQKPPWLKEVFGIGLGAGGGQAVSPARQSLDYFLLGGGGNSIFIKILTYIPFLLPNQKTTKTKQLC